MLILTRRKGETIHIGDEIVAVVSSVTPKRVCVDLVLNKGDAVSLGETRLEHSGFVRRSVSRGDTFRIGEEIALKICDKDRSPSQVAIGITAPKHVVILRGELYAQQQLVKGRDAA